MPIGTSDGEYFDNKFEAMVGSGVTAGLKRVPVYKDKDPEVNPGIDPGDDAMVVSPNKLQLGKELDQTELDPTTGTGLPISYRRPLGGSTEPAGALKQEEGTRVALPNNFDVSEVDWSKLNQPLGELKGTGKEDTPVVATAAGGRIRITEGDIKEATEMAGNFMGTMVGVKAKTFDKNKLAQAQIMAADGVHPDVIHAETGTFRGVDGRWRQELDDSAAKFDPEWSVDRSPPKPSWSKVEKEPVSKALPEVVDHPELFKAYPELKDVKVRFDPGHPSAHWDKTRNEIVVGEHFRADKGTIYHEIQHAVQDIEGFAKGTFPGKAVEHFQLKLDEAFQPIVERFKELYKISKERNLTDEEFAETKHLRFVVKKYNEYYQAANKESVNYYMKSAGETEARNVDTRVLMSKNDRKNTPPWYTEDLPPDQQIVAIKPNWSSAYGIHEIK